eukprot:2615364-Prorocentrum_lima.AAC.1
MGHHGSSMCGSSPPSDGGAASAASSSHSAADGAPGAIAPSGRFGARLGNETNKVLLGQTGY